LGQHLPPLSDAETSQTNKDWFKHSAISPDGKSVLFSYQGDIYKVSSKGGTAQHLTVHSAWEGNPVWSHDGNNIMLKQLEGYN
jgi:Tol biopolymer transport system component